MTRDMTSVSTDNPPASDRQAHQQLDLADHIMDLFQVDLVLVRQLSSAATFL